MSLSNPYRQFIQDHAELLKHGTTLPLGTVAPPRHPSANNANGTVLIFSPHPDDECVIGGLPLRLMREDGMQVINVAVTLGRHPERQEPRWRELENACAYLGFGLKRATEAGLPDINLDNRAEQPERWSAAVAMIAAVLEAEQPDIILVPHDDDWHPAHIGTHHLVTDALAGLPPSFACHVVETEFWRAMASPNLMIESSTVDVAELAAALSLHVGEVARNPYHLRLPAWMIDNVRRGAELIRGRGEAAPDMTFATLYRLRCWTNGGFQDVLPEGKILTTTDDLRPLFV